MQERRRPWHHARRRRRRQPRARRRASTSPPTSREAAAAEGAGRAAAEWTHAAAEYTGSDGPADGSAALRPALRVAKRVVKHTILLSDLQPQAVPAARLQRMQPPGRSDIITLDRTHYLMGRLPSCDLRLYSQTASREHAQLSARAGRWYLTPVTGKVVLVNGTQVKEEVPLTHKMRLQLGGDELVYLDESGVTAVESAPRASAERGDNRWLLVLIGVLTLAAVLWLWAIR